MAPGGDKPDGEGDVDDVGGDDEPIAERVKDENCKTKCPEEQKIRDQCDRCEVCTVCSSCDDPIPECDRCPICMKEESICVKCCGY